MDRAFTYRVPDELAEDAQVGSRVLVPFGPRRLTGLIVAEEPAPDPTLKLKSVLDVLDDEPAFTPEMLRLTKWMAEYYVCGWGEVVKAALPTGTEVETQYTVVRTDKYIDVQVRGAVGKKVIAYLDEHRTVSLSGLRKDLGDIGMATLRRLEGDGLLTIEMALSKPKVRIKRQKHMRLAPAFQSPEAVRDLGVQLRGEKQVAVVEALAALLMDGYAAPRQAEVLVRSGAAATTVRSLAKKGIVEVFEQEVIRSPLGDMPVDAGKPPVRDLHRGQQQALDRINSAIDAGRFETFLLHGVTGSGKTEVYIAALKDVLARGKSAIILVPEIALTPQTVSRFRAHFGDQIAVLHSRMSLGERYDAWRQLRAGRYRIVIGPRSAILAPLTNIGLIVVDEEHESSYKQFDPAPRYHARDVAVLRAHLNNAACILGSATPSMESWTNAHWGKYTLLSMPDRVPVPGRKAAPLPTVTIIDLALEQKKKQLHGAFSNPLREAIQKRLDREEQVILLQNRRGYAPILECESCGWSPTCPDCSVTFTYHKPMRQLRCHYCGRTQRTPRTCPKCGESELSLLGSGTQRVEEELLQVFPAARILRMDLDTTTKKNAHHKLLDLFGRGEADILLGTQMVAKGLDFGRVTLVGVINADMGLLLPDFRAEERIFQLLTQVAGRAGRASLQGEVILQTRNPGHAVLRYACNHDYVGFVEAALPDRRMLNYPPFGRVVGIEFRGMQEREVEKIAKKWTEAFQRILTRKKLIAVEVMGPHPAFIGRIKRQYRFHTIVKAVRSSNIPALQPMLAEATRQTGSLPRGYHIGVDVDPVALF